MTARRGRLVAGIAAMALVAGCSAASAGRADEPLPAATSRAPATTANGVDAARGFRSTRGYQATPAPVRIQIPRIHVASSLDRLGRAPDKTVQVPSRWQVAGWYALRTRPGDPGSAVILGHVDSKRGPAVRFAVDRTEQFDKQRFPTDAVYYPTLTPALRLVTCGGEFDATAGHYRSNVIVFATLKT
jgi:hypothetical protein